MWTRGEFQIHEAEKRRARDPNAGYVAELLSNEKRMSVKTLWTDDVARDQGDMAGDQYAVP